MNATPPRETPDVAVRAARCGTVVLLSVAFASVAFTSRVIESETGARGAALRLDPNVATKDELMLLPDVGETTADAIIAARRSPDRPIAFASPADLDRVRFIGPRRIEKLRPHLRFATQGSE